MKQTRPTNRRGSNQHTTKKRSNVHYLIPVYLGFALLLVGGHVVVPNLPKTPEVAHASTIISPLPEANQATTSAPLTVKQHAVKGSPTPTPTPSELEQIVSYIARKFEPEGKQVVVRAINCFYSESGLRRDAVGQNSDTHRSKDHGVAQLNDYWHKLTLAQKTDIYANIDKAYEIYKGRSRNGGNGFSAWYGRLCNE